METEQDFICYDSCCNSVEQSLVKLVQSKDISTAELHYSLIKSYINSIFQTKLARFTGYSIEQQIKDKIAERRANRDNVQRTSIMSHEFYR